jgi:hypothetical protein
VPPKIRSPLVSWLLTLFSGGFYLLFWVWLVAGELNHAERKTVLNAHLWRRIAAALLLTTFLGMAWAAGTQNPIPFLVPFLTLFGFCIYVQIAIGNYIKAKDRELNTGGSYSNALSVFLLWVVANSGVAYMQTAINRVIEHERMRS